MASEKTKGEPDAATRTVEEFTSQEYKYGFVTEIDADAMPPGLDENVVRAISANKNEPAFLLEWRLRPSRRWCRVPERQQRLYPRRLPSGPV